MTEFPRLDLLAGWTNDLRRVAVHSWILAGNARDSACKQSPKIVCVFFQGRSSRFAIQDAGFGILWRARQPLLTRTAQKRARPEEYQRVPSFVQDSTEHITLAVIARSFRR
jgi:hypothetical protein